MDNLYNENVTSPLLIMLSPLDVSQKYCNIWDTHSVQRAVVRLLPSSGIESESLWFVATRAANVPQRKIIYRVMYDKHVCCTYMN